MLDLSIAERRRKSKEAKKDAEIDRLVARNQRDLVHARERPVPPLSDRSLDRLYGPITTKANGDYESGRVRYKTYIFFKIKQIE